MVKIRTGALDDANQVVIGFIGWGGEIGRMVIFHWCNLPLERKWRELVQVYDAAESIEGAIPFDIAVASVSSLGQNQGGAWALVHKAWSIFEYYRLEAPPDRLASTRCW